MFYENVFDVNNNNNNVKGCALVLECGGPNLQQLITQMRDEKNNNAQQTGFHGLIIQMYMRSISNALKLHSQSWLCLDRFKASEFGVVQ